MSHEPFDALVQDCWDNGRDPVDDLRVQDHLLADPDALARFAQWRASVRHVGRVPHRSRRGPWVAAAAAVALSALGWALSGGDVSAATEARGAVLSSSLQSVAQRPGPTVSWSERRVLVESPDTYFAITERRSAPR